MRIKLEYCVFASKLVPVFAKSILLKPSCFLRRFCCLENSVLQWWKITFCNNLIYYYIQSIFNVSFCLIFVFCFKCHNFEALIFYSASIFKWQLQSWECWFSTSCQANSLFFFVISWYNVLYWHQKNIRLFIFRFSSISVLSS